MRKLLALLLGLMIASPAFSTVTYVQNAGASGQIPTTNGASITVTGGDTIICAVGEHGTGTVAQTGSATTLASLSVSGSTSFNDGVGSSYGVSYNVSATAGAQTFSVTSVTSNYVNTLQFCMDFSGAASIQNATYAVVAAPGTGAGAISGVPITVATTDKMLVCLWDASYFNTIPTVNGPASSTNINTYGPSGCWYWAGTGSAYTPTFTAAATFGGDTYIVIQMDVSASAGGGSAGILMSNGHPVLSNSHPVLSN